MDCPLSVVSPLAGVQLDMGVVTKGYIGDLKVRKLADISACGFYSFLKAGQENTEQEPPV